MEIIFKSKPTSLRLHVRKANNLYQATNTERLTVVRICLMGSMCLFKSQQIRRNLHTTDGAQCEHFQTKAYSMIDVRYFSFVLFFNIRLFYFYFILVLTFLFKLQGLCSKFERYLK